MERQPRALTRKLDRVERARAMRDYEIQHQNQNGQRITVYVRKGNPQDHLIVWRRTTIKQMFDQYLTKPGNGALELWLWLGKWKSEQQHTGDEMRKEWAEHCFHTAMQVWDDGYIQPAPQEIPNLLGV